MTNMMYGVEQCKKIERICFGCFFGPITFALVYLQSTTRNTNTNYTRQQVFFFINTVGSGGLPKYNKKYKYKQNYKIQKVALVVFPNTVGSGGPAK